MKKIDFYLMWIPVVGLVWHYKAVEHHNGYDSMRYLLLNALYHSICIATIITLIKLV